MGCMCMGDGTRHAVGGPPCVVVRRRPEGARVRRGASLVGRCAG